MSDLVAGFEDAVKAMTEHLLDAHKVLQEQIGTRKFGEDHVPETEQARNAGLIWHDPNAWASIIQEHGPNEAVGYLLRGQSLQRQYPDHFQEGVLAGTVGGNQPPQPEAPDTSTDTGAGDGVLG